MELLELFLSHTSCKFMYFFSVPSLYT